MRAERGWWPGLVDGVGSAVRGVGAIPPPLQVLLGVISVQVGGAVAKTMFASAGPMGIVALRLVFAAAVLVLIWRPRVWREAWGTVVSYGVVLATMNLLFYLAIARIPLGIAVTIEFLGPLAVALVGSRKVLDVLWALMAAAGVVLLARAGGDVDLIGVALAAGAGACWAGYILLSHRLGSRTTGGGGLALGMVVAAAVAVPAGVADAGGALLQPSVLIAGLAVALLSSVIPYSLELQALRKIPPRVFGVLMSLEPAVAAVTGLLVLHELLHPAQWVAICLVVAASVGVTRR
ncbi:EamA family transporter [Actinokineospora sp. NPDC004072]